VLRLRLLQQLRELPEGVRVGELAAGVVEPLLKVCPDGVVDLRGGELPYVLRLRLAEGVVREIFRATPMTAKSPGGGRGCEGVRAPG